MTLEQRKEVSNLIIETVNDFNKQLGRQNNVSEEEIANMLDNTYAQLEYVAGIIYDALKINNYLK